MGKNLKAIYFTNEYNPANPAAGAQCITYDKVNGFQFIDSGKVINVISETDAAQTAEIETLKNEIKELKFTIGRGQIVTDDSITVNVVSGNIVDPAKDIVIEKTTKPVDAVYTVSGKNVEIQSIDVATGGRLDIKSAESVVIKSIETSGELAKKTSNASISINPTAGSVTIDSANLNQTSYNAVEIGLAKTSVPTEITITNLYIKNISNNGINIFNTADGAVVNITGCTISKCSNPIRISNRNNGKVTFNITDCEFVTWDSSPDWAGMILCQDCDAGSEKQAEKDNRFAPDKVIFNIKNCTKGGVLIKEEDFTVGTFTEEQILYVWNAYDGGNKIYKFKEASVVTEEVPETVDGVETIKTVETESPAVDNTHRYPTINFLD